MSIHRKRLNEHRQNKTNHFQSMFFLSKCFINEKNTFYKQREVGDRILCTASNRLRFWFWSRLLVIEEKEKTQFNLSLKTVLLTEKTSSKYSLNPWNIVKDSSQLIYILPIFMIVIILSSVQNTCYNKSRRILFCFILAKDMI